MIFVFHGGSKGRSVQVSDKANIRLPYEWKPVVGLLRAN